MTTTSKTYPHAFMMVEASVAIVLMGVLLAMVSRFSAGYNRATDYYLNYRRVELAAESQVERMRAFLLPVKTTTFTDEAGISYQIEIEDAPAQWAPLKRVTVTAQAIGKNSRRIRFKIHAFVNSFESDKKAEPK